MHVSLSIQQVKHIIDWSDTYFHWWTYWCGWRLLIHMYAGCESLLVLWEVSLKKLDNRLNLFIHCTSKRELKQTLAQMKLEVNAPEASASSASSRTNVSDLGTSSDKVLQVCNQVNTPSLIPHFAHGQGNLCWLQNSWKTWKVLSSLSTLGYCRNSSKQFTRCRAPMSTYLLQPCEVSSTAALHQTKITLSDAAQRSHMTQSRQPSLEWTVMERANIANTKHIVSIVSIHSALCPSLLSFSFCSHNILTSIAKSNISHQPELYNCRLKFIQP